ncbi:MAG: hypothetical protein WB507_08065, partial [Solirubrobacterales bacterium]
VFVDFAAAAFFATFAFVRFAVLAVLVFTDLAFLAVFAFALLAAFLLVFLAAIQRLRLQLTGFWLLLMPSATVAAGSGA